MLKLSLKEGQYVNIGDDIRIVFAGGTGKHCRLLIDAPKELNIARSNNEPDPAKRKDTYYPDPEISNEAQKLIGGCGASHTREAACYRKPQLLK